jgi:PKD repeat protein
VVGSAGWAGEPGTIRPERSGEHGDTKAQVTVSTAAELADAIASANQGGPDEILLEDGTYTIDATYGLIVEADGVTVRSLSGNRESVIIEGEGMYGSITHIFQVAGDGFAARDMTLRGVANHAIQIHGEDDADSPLLSNLHILDTYEQMIKVSYQSGSSVGSDDGVLEGCLLEYSAGIGPQYYIGGFDGHLCGDWVVRDNTFIGIRSPSDDVAEHAVHFWSDSHGTVVERNLIINCDRGIGFGLGDRGHSGGIIRNNMIYHDSSEGFADVGIALESASDIQVYNNTIFFENSYENAIEVRFSASTGVEILNNLTNRVIRERDGAVATISHNNLGADRIWFVDARSGDLHLASPIVTVVDQGVAIAGLSDDFDGQPRPQGAGIDIGADEYTEGSTVPVAAFSWTPQSPTVGQEVQFTDLSTGNPTSRNWSFGDSGVSAEVNPRHSYSQADTYTVSLTVSNASGSDTTTQSLIVVTADQSPPVTNPGAYIYVIPAAAKAAGALGTNWVTDMVMNNAEASWATTYLYFLESDRNNSGAVGVKVEVQTGTSRRLDDVVATTLGRQSVTGAIVVGSNQHLVVTSRTYNDQRDDGTFGQYIPGLVLETALAQGDPARLVQLASNNLYRTNIGMVNLANRWITVDVTVYSGIGLVLGSDSYNLKPFEHRQDNDVIGDITSAAVVDAFAVVNSDTSGASFFAYASVIDNRSGDAVYIPASR